MPSPLGHSLAGLAVAWFVQPESATSGPPGAHHAVGSPSPRHRTPFTGTVWFWCALTAALPDIDLIIPQAHRSATHSVTASLLIFIVTVVVTGKVTPRPAWGLATALAVAHASHLLLDWLGSDRFPPFGLQAFWPFSDRFYISGVDLFPPVERRLLRPEAFSVNAYAALAEVLIAGPVALTAWFTARIRCRAGRAAHEIGAGAALPAARLSEKSPADDTRGATDAPLATAVSRSHSAEPAESRAALGTRRSPLE